MLIDAATRPAWQFPDARPDSQNKVLWVLIVALGGWIGALVYYFMIFKKMGKANSSLPAPPWWYQPPPAYPPAGMAYAGQPGPPQPYPQPGGAYTGQPYPQPGGGHTGRPYPQPPGISAPGEIEAPVATPNVADPAQFAPAAETQQLPRIESPTDVATQD